MGHTHVLLVMIMVNIFQNDYTYLKTSMSKTYLLHIFYLVILVSKDFGGLVKVSVDIFSLMVALLYVCFILI